MNKPSFQKLALVGLLSIVSALGLTACERKKRLTDTFRSFTITPPAATVVKNTPLVLTANTGGSSPANPVWEVSPSSAGTLSPSVGATVTFTPTTLGDALVVATYEGQQATSQIAVVTYVPSSNTFDVYNDDGLPSGSGILSDIFVGGLTLSEQSSGYTPEGLTYQRATANTGHFWGVTLDKNVAGLSKDLSAFSLGSLKFSIRLGRNLGAAENLFIEIDDTAAGPGVNPGQVELTFPNDYINELTTDWQEITIPLSAFAPAQTLSSMRVPFAISLQNMASPLTFDVDAIRWEK